MFISAEMSRSAKSTIAFVLLVWWSVWHRITFCNCLHVYFGLFCICLPTCHSLKTELHYMANSLKTELHYLSQYLTHQSWGQFHPSSGAQLAQAHSKKRGSSLSVQKLPKIRSSESYLTHLKKKAVKVRSPSIAENQKASDSNVHNHEVHNHEWSWICSTNPKILEWGAGTLYNLKYKTNKRKPNVHRE